MSTFHSFAAFEAKGALRPFEFDPGPLGSGQVEIKVESCGLCHSDLSMLDNDWGFTAYPFVGGHEIVGTVEAAGPEVKNVTVGQRVGVGWYTESCLACPQCLSGHHNLCPTAEQTIVGRHGGFGDRLRSHWSWTTPLPDGVNPASAGPLFCGGITVFGPIHDLGVKPVDRVVVIGIGGLGHMALRFLHAWGCEVTVFSTNPAKADEARALGAHHFVNSRDTDALKKLSGRFDFILSTVNAPMDWDLYVAALAPLGRLHVVGAVLEPIPVGAFSLITGGKSISGSPLGGPATLRKMLDFCARHAIEPVTETFPMSKINDALEHLRAGKARYRIVLKNDL